jgi:hypothetical protein
VSTALNKKSRRPLVYALIVIFLWFGASGVFGPLFGKLSTVQENDNSAFLPDSAESTQAAKIIESWKAYRKPGLEYYFHNWADHAPAGCFEDRQHRRNVRAAFEAMGFIFGD